MNKKNQIIIFIGILLIILLIIILPIIVLIKNNTNINTKYKPEFQSWIRPDIYTEAVQRNPKSTYIKNTWKSYADWFLKMRQGAVSVQTVMPATIEYHYSSGDDNKVTATELGDINNTFSLTDTGNINSSDNKFTEGFQSAMDDYVKVGGHVCADFADDWFTSMMGAKIPTEVKKKLTIAPDASPKSCALKIIQILELYHTNRITIDIEAGYETSNPSTQLWWQLLGKTLGYASEYFKIINGNKSWYKPMFTSFSLNPWADKESSTKHEYGLTQLYDFAYHASAVDNNPKIVFGLTVLLYIFSDKDVKTVPIAKQFYDLLITNGIKNIMKYIKFDKPMNYSTFERNYYGLCIESAESPEDASGSNAVFKNIKSFNSIIDYFVDKSKNFRTINFFSTSQEQSKLYNYPMWYQENYIMKKINELK